MLLAKRILILLRKYLHNNELRKKYGRWDESHFNTDETSETSFLGFLRHERHIRLSIKDRIYLESEKLKRLFGFEKKKQGPSEASMRRFKLWKEKIGDALDWCEKKKFIKYDEYNRDKVTLLSAGRRFTKVFPFFNEAAKEYSPLKGFLTGTGLGAGIGFALSLLISRLLG